MVTFPSASTKLSRSDWCNIRVCRGYGNPFKVSFPITLPAATGVVPEANGAAGIVCCNDFTHYVYG
jgi:hypothetical protein